MISSPNSPSPRLNALTNFPFSYRKLALTPSIFNSAQYSKLPRIVEVLLLNVSSSSSSSLSSVKLFITLSSNSRISFSVNAFFKLFIGDKCLYFLYSNDPLSLEEEGDEDEDEDAFPLPTRMSKPSPYLPFNASNLFSTASNFILNIS